MCIHQLRRQAVSLLTLFLLFHGLMTIPTISMFGNAKWMDGMGWAGMDITWYNVITMWQAQLKTVPFSNHFSGHFTSSQVGAYPTNKSLLGMGYQLINYVCYWVYHGLPHIISVFLSNLPSFRFFQGIVGRHQQLETLLSEHRLDPMVFPEDLTMFSMPFPCLFMVFYVFFMFF